MEKGNDPQALRRWKSKRLMGPGIGALIGGALGVAWGILPRSNTIGDLVANVLFLALVGAGLGQWVATSGTRHVKDGAPIDRGALIGLLLGGIATAMAIVVVILIANDLYQLDGFAAVWLGAMLIGSASLWVLLSAKRRISGAHGQLGGRTLVNLGLVNAVLGSALMMGTFVILGSFSVTS